MTSNAQPTWELYSARQRWSLVGVLFLVATVNYLDRNIIGVLLEPIKAEFGVSDTMLGLLTGASFAILFATLGLPIAYWADRGDRKLIITLSLTVWSAMTVLCGMAQSFLHLALARIGVGAGEAGAIPPAQSLIADYFPPEKRATALGVFLMASVIGYALGLIGGGLVAQHYGWRVTFILAGAPGLLLALIVLAALHEPRRTMRVASFKPQSETALQSIRHLLSKRSFVYLLASVTFYCLLAYGALIFTVAYIMRAYQVSVAEAGVLFGLVSAFAAVAGNFLGGMITDRLARHDIRWIAWLPGIGLLIAFPLYTAVFLTTSLNLMLILIALGGTILTGVMPALFAGVHMVCGASRRSMAVALVLFAGNLLGMTLGPLLAGALSDYLARYWGAAEGLRYALTASMLILLPSALCALRAAHFVPSDKEH